MAGKVTNEYSRQISFYEQCPKAVFAAIAVSVFTCGGDWLPKAHENVLAEWWALYHNHIVSQKPPLPDPSDI